MFEYFLVNFVFVHVSSTPAEAWVSRFHRGIMFLPQLSVAGKRV